MQKSRLRIAILALALVTNVVSVAHAQVKSNPPAPSATPSAIAAAKTFVGTWEGGVTTPDGKSPMKLVIESAGDGKLKVKSMAVAMMGSEMQELNVRDAVVTDSVLTWTLEAMGSACRARATVRTGEMTGSMACGGQADFTLYRK